MKKLRRMKLADVAPKYLDSLRGKVKESTMACYESMFVSSKFHNEIKGRFVDELDYPFLQLWLDGMGEHTKYVVMYTICLKTLIRWAADMDLCKTPEQSARRFRFKRMERKYAGTEISDDDYAKLAAKAQDEAGKSRLANAVLVAMNTGMRVGEICGLRPCDVSEQSHAISVSRSLRRIYSPLTHRTSVITDSPKTKSSARTIPVGDDVLAMIRAASGLRRKRSGAAGAIMETVFKCEPRELGEYFQRLQVRSSLSRHYSFHSIRHTFISRKIRAGASPKAVSRYVGHSNLEITLAVYTHVSEEDLKKVAMA